MQLDKEHHTDAYCISLVNKTINAKIMPDRVYKLQRFKKKSGNNINALNKREYYLDGKLVAVNRHKATDQKDDSLEELLNKYRETHSDKELRQLMHQIEINYQCVSTIEFVILGGIFKFFIAGFLFLTFKNREGQRSEKNNFSKSLIVIILSAVIGGTAYFLQLYGAKSLPATLLYPFITGGSIVFSTLIGAVLFKEKLSRKLIISVVLCFAGTIMFI